MITRYSFSFWHNNNKKFLKKKLSHTLLKRALVSELSVKARTLVQSSIAGLKESIFR
jgi:hypothetical protein